MDADRLLIVNADDFGYSRGVNRGIIEAHECGIVTSASLMVRWPGVHEAAEYARANPRLSVGLHLDLGEWVFREDEWRARYLVVEPDAEPARFAEEVRRQLDAFRALVGREPSHLDSHQHFHRDEPVSTALLGVAAKLGVPVRDFTPGIRYCGDFYGQCGRGESYPELVSAAALRRTLAELPPGITELGCHPAAEVDFESAYASERLLERAALCDATVRKILVAQSLRLISFHDIPSTPRT